MIPDDTMKVMRAPGCLNAGQRSLVAARQMYWIRPLTPIVLRPMTPAYPAYYAILENATNIDLQLMLAQCWASFVDDGTTII